MHLQLRRQGLVLIFNSTNEQDWVNAAELLAQQKDKVNPVYVMDEVFNLMESGEYAFATYYAGDYVLMNENNSDLGYLYSGRRSKCFL